MTIKEIVRCIRIIQINVGRNLRVMPELKEYCTKHKIVCIQEFAIKYGTLVNIDSSIIAKTQ
jgi:hypothetical protein